MTENNLSFLFCKEKICLIFETLGDELSDSESVQDQRSHLESVTVQ